jgi:quinol monooxygenase YgiN
VIRVSLLIVARSGEVRGLAAALRSVAAQALTQPGCLESYASTDLTIGEALHYTELWSSEAYFRAQIRSERFKRLIRVIEAAAEPPRLHVQVVARTHGLEYIEDVLRGDAP